MTYYWAKFSLNSFSKAVQIGEREGFDDKQGKPPPLEKRGWGSCFVPLSFQKHSGR